MAPDVIASELWKRYQDDQGKTVFALRGVSLVIEPGQFYVLVGDSGSGKTTLMRSVAGLESPDSGEVVLRGEIASSMKSGIFVPPQERNIGMVFQSYAIWPHLTVAENVSLPLLYGRRRRSKTAARDSVMEALEIVGLSALADRPAPNLSGGQQQRVALARAIAASSKLLLMDEPMSNLDARLRIEVRTQFRSIAKQLGTTVLYVTHDQEEAMALGDQMALMRDGEILQRGTPKELYDRSNSPEVAEFFGPMNLVDCEAVSPLEVITSFGRVQLEGAGAPAKYLKIGIRPERVQLALAYKERVNSFAAHVENRVFLGGLNAYELRVGETLLRACSVLDLDDGAKVFVCLPPEELRVFSVPAH